MDHKFDLDTIEEIRTVFQETADRWNKSFSVHWNDGKGIAQEVFSPKKDENPVLPGLWESASFPRLGEGQ